MRTINLDKEISERVHLPKVDNMPLYVRLDNNLDEYIKKKLEKSEKWLEKAKTIYNSPDNIRRVFITYKAVHIEYFRPIKGTNEKKLTKTSTFDIPFDEIYNILIKDYTEGRKLSYRVINYGLKALYKPWVCSNIEEIYFDWSLFLSEHIQNLGYGDLFEYYKEPRKNNEEPIKKILETACLSDGCKLEERYPRLKCVGYISNLEMLYNQVPKKPGIKDLEDLNEVWCLNDLVIKGVKSGETIISIYEISKPSFNIKYSIKESLYKYDKEVLKPYFEDIKAKIKRTRHTQKSDLEKILDMIYKNSDEKQALAAIKIIFKDINEEEKEKILNQMSEKGREKYAVILKETYGGF